MNTRSQLTIPSIASRVTPEEWQVREDLAACYRLVAYYGWDDMIFTHISAAVPGGAGQFLINPYGLLFEEITASSLIKVDLHGNKLDDSPFPVNPAGFTIHSAVHEVRHDAGCVIHLHSLDGSAVSAMPEGLLPLNQTAMLVRSDLAFHEYEGVALDHDERPRLQQDLGRRNLMLLRNHGTLACGETVAEAFMRIYFLERACSMQVRTLAGSGDRWHRPLDGIEARTASQGQDPEMARMVTRKLAWPALKRMLERRDASFRT